MTTLTQTGEGPNGTTITNANCTNATQFDTVIKSGTGTTQTFDNANVVHGRTTAIKNHYAAVASTAYYSWKASIPSTATDAYARFYIYLTAYPNVAVRLCNMLSGAGVSCGALNMTATGQIRTTNSSGTNVLTTTGVMPLSAWVRVEFEITGISGSTGTLAGRMYSGANLETTTPDTNGSLSSSAQAVTGVVNEFRLATSSSLTVSPAWDIAYQDVAWSDTAQPGPVSLTSNAGQFFTMF